MENMNDPNGPQDISSLADFLYIFGSKWAIEPLVSHFAHLMNTGSRPLIGSRVIPKLISNNFQKMLTCSHFQ